MAVFDYIVRQPKNSTQNKPPLLLLLHGYGSNENDLFSFANHLHPSLLVVSLRAPHALPMMGFAWYSIHFDGEQGKWSDDGEAIASREMVLQFLDELQQTHLYDPIKVHLLGFSQGAILSYALGLTYPKRFTSVIALSGYLNENISELPEPAEAPALYAAHGTLDEVVPFDWDSNRQCNLNKKALTFSLTSFLLDILLDKMVFISFWSGKMPN